MATVTTDMVRSELEKLEQNITLTLQAIDQNFAKCHHVVSTKVLPHVERYAEASREVWDGSKFWLYFFESLETPSLPGQTTQLAQTAASSRPFHDASFAHDAETSILHDAAASPPPTSSRWNDNIIQSPWERLKREIDMETMSEISSIAPPPKVSDVSGLGGRNRAVEPSPASLSLAMSTPKPEYLNQKKKKPKTPQSAKLLSKVLNKQHAAAAIQGQQQAQQRQRSVNASVLSAQSGSTSFSLPQVASSTGSRNARQATRPQGDTTFNLADLDKAADDDDDDDEFDMNKLPYSPPITLQFALPPSKLLKTPAKIAAKTIVDDILQTAGGSQDVPTPPELRGFGAAQRDANAGIENMWRTKASGDMSMTETETGTEPSFTARYDQPPPLQSVGLGGGGGAASANTSMLSSRGANTSILNNRGVNTSVLSSRGANTSGGVLARPAYTNYDFDDDEDDRDIEKLLNITTKLSPLMGQERARADWPVVGGSDAGSGRKRSVVTPGKIDAMLDDEDEMMDDGGITPSRIDRLLDEEDEDDDDDDEDMEMDDDFAGTSHAIQHLRRPASGTPGPVRTHGNGSGGVPLVLNEELDPAEFEDDDDDEDEDIVNSPCPPGIWLNAGGFTPKGNSHSPFRLVGSPTLHRVMDNVNTRWSGGGKRGVAPGGSGGSARQHLMEAMPDFRSGSGRGSRSGRGGMQLDSDEEGDVVGGGMREEMDLGGGSAGSRGRSGSLAQRFGALAVPSQAAGNAAFSSDYDQAPLSGDSTHRLLQQQQQQQQQRQQQPQQQQQRQKFGARASLDSSAAGTISFSMRGPTEFRPEFDAISTQDATVTMNFSEIGASETGTGNLSFLSMGRRTSIGGPPKFSLDLFPLAFQQPPGSTQLARVYETFVNSSDLVSATALTLPTLKVTLNRPGGAEDYDDDKILLLVDLLVRKKFLKRDGNGWSLRR